MTQQPSMQLDEIKAARGDLGFRSMPLFLTETERTAVADARKCDPLRSFYWALINRVELRAASPRLGNLTP